MSPHATPLGEIRISGDGAQVQARRKLLRTLAHCRALRATQMIGCCSLLSEVCGQALQQLPALQLNLLLDEQVLVVEIRPAGAHPWPEQPPPEMLGAGLSLARMRGGLRLGCRLERAPTAAEMVAMQHQFQEASREELFALIQAQNRELSAAHARAEAATRAKSEFLANMSHEIRTPMNAVLGLAHLALQTELSERQRDYVTKIHGAGQHLLGLINGVLDFSKVEAGRMELEHVEFDLDSVFENLAMLVGERAEAKGLELLFDVDAGIDCLLVGDPLRVGQVLINLTANAIKFTERGEIVVRVRCTARDEQALTLRIEVVDTGMGMTAAQSARLFRSFEQADSSVTRRFGGTGLGLAISKAMVELLQGEIGVESEPGRGSRFWCTMRLGRGRDKPALRAPAGLRGRRILVVDDHDSTRNALSQVLRGMGFEVEQAADGLEALERLAAAAAAGQPYDVALLDWRMPGLDGIALRRRLTAQPQPAPPCVLLTGYGHDPALRAAELAGFAGVLIKPVSASLLFDTLHGLLGGPVPAPTPGPAVAPAERLQGLRVLLVEDNALNQQVATEMLSAAGARVTVAGDGQQALHVLEAGGLDVVLMDMQMPVLDGLSAARAWRRREAERGEGGRVAIVALTANAVADDREQCLAAGMDDHLAKPLDPNRLVATLERWAPRRDGAGAAGRTDATPAAPLADQPAPLDLARLRAGGLEVDVALERLMGRTALYATIVARFCDEPSGYLQLARQALEAGDATTALRAAHTTRGVAGLLGAGQLALCAGRFEAALHRHDLAAAALALAQGQDLQQSLMALLVAASAPPPKPNRPLPFHES